MGEWKDRLCPLLNSTCIEERCHFWLNPTIDSSITIDRACPECSAALTLREGQIVCEECGYREGESPVPVPLPDLTPHPVCAIVATGLRAQWKMNSIEERLRR